MEGAYQRTGKSLHNSVVALIIQVLSLLLGFFSRKVFLDYLGAEVLGLNTTASSLLNFLNLAELGIGNAVAFSLYRPLYDGDKNKIQEILALQGWLYRRVAFFILGASAVAMCFFGRIFTKMGDLPMSYAYGSFIVLLFSAMLGYFVNYKQAVLTADQKDYKVQINYRLTMVVKVLFQMVAVIFLPHPYLWWLVVEALFAVIASWLLQRSVVREYPYLKERRRVNRDTLRKYPDVITKIKQLFIHKVGFYATVQITPLLIYAYTSFRDVGYYGNYMVLIYSLTAILTALFASSTASVGNMIAEGNRDLILKVYRELFSARFFLMAFSCVVLWFLASPFITHWLGAEYLLPNRTLLLMILVFYLTNMYTVTEIYINASGLFSDVWSTIVQIIIFLALAVLLGSRMGLDGVLLASVVQLTLLTVLWRPWFLFHRGIQQRYTHYVGLYLKLLVLGAVAIAAGALLIRLLPWDPTAGIGTFLLYALVVCAVFALLLYGILYLCEPSMRGFTQRIFKIIRR